MPGTSGVHRRSMVTSVLGGHRCRAVAGRPRGPLSMLLRPWVAGFDRSEHVRRGRAARTLCSDDTGRPGPAATLRTSCASPFGGPRAPGRWTGSRCWASRSLQSSASRSMICSAAGSPHSARSTCPPQAGWLSTDSSCCPPRSARTSPCAFTAPTIRSSCTCSALRSLIPRTLEARPDGEED